MPKYKTLSPLKHDGEILKIGSPVDLDEKSAKDLLGLKIIEVYTVAVPSDTEARLAAIREAIGSLDKKDSDNWLQSGAPDLAAIEAALGWAPTAAERDAAWAAIKG